MNAGEEVKNEFVKIDKQKMAERLKEDICRLVGKQEFDVAVGFANCVERFEE